MKLSVVVNLKCRKIAIKIVPRVKSFWFAFRAKAFFQ